MIISFLSVCLRHLSSLHKFYLLLVLFPGGCHTKTSALRINLSNLPSLSVNYCPWSLLQSFPFINIYWHTLVNPNTIYVLCKWNIYFHFRTSFINVYDATLVKLFYLGIVSFLESSRLKKKKINKSNHIWQTAIWQHLLYMT